LTLFFFFFFASLVIIWTCCGCCWRSSATPHPHRTDLECRKAADLRTVINNKSRLAWVPLSQQNTVYCLHIPLCLPIEVNKLQVAAAATAAAAAAPLPCLRWPRFAPGDSICTAPQILAGGCPRPSFNFTTDYGIRNTYYYHYPPPFGRVCPRSSSFPTHGEEEKG
jgi:hypothetical protein